jgi:hypothetical protein
MTKIEIYKADPITNDESVEDAEIHICREIPKDITLQDATELFRESAELIYKILENHLPQGTRHQLLIVMLEKHVNLYHGR